MTIAAPTPAPTTTQEYICPSCGKVPTRGKQAVTGVLQAVGWFLLVPAIAAILVLILGSEAVAQNSPFIAIAWVFLGLPAAGAALRKAFSRACPDCGSKDLVALATPEGQHLLTHRPKSSALAGHTGDPTAIAALPDGRLVSGSKDMTVRVWDTSEARTEPVVLTGHTGPVTAIAVLTDGRVASGSKDNTVRVWDPSGLKPPSSSRSTSTR
jgi:predicted RNA-binding Zn-ribbon protein involved in translation (DUF1610 family)